MEISKEEKITRVVEFIVMLFFIGVSVRIGCVISIPLLLILNYGIKKYDNGIENYYNNKIKKYLNIAFKYSIHINILNVVFLLLILINAIHMHNPEYMKKITIIFYLIRIEWALYVLLAIVILIVLITTFTIKNIKERMN